LIGWLLCKIGFHRFEAVEGYDKEKCSRCDDEQIVIYAILESDLKAMVDRGDISEAEYSKAVQRGFLQKEKS